MKKLLPFLKDFKKECVLGPLFKMLEALFELLVPLVVAEMIDVGIARGDTPYILKMLLTMVLFAAVSLSNTLLAQYFAAKAATGFSGQLRAALMKRVMALPRADFEALGASEIITRMTDDVNQLQNGVNLTLRLLLRSPFIVLGAMVVAFTVDVKGALVFAVVIPLLSVCVFAIMAFTVPRYRNIQNRLDGVTLRVRETLSGSRVIRAFGLQDRETSDFARENGALCALQERVGKISALLNPLTTLILNAGVIALLWVGGVRVNAGALTTGEVVALYNLMSQILVELIKFANLVLTLTKSFACAERLSALLDAGTIQPEPETAPDVPPQKRGTVCFSHVSFTYPGCAAPALSDVSFTAKPGEFIGIVGGTGSGKTTLVNLIARFYEPQSGEILLDGAPAKAFPKENLRARIGVAAQKSALFRGTIRENLLWGDKNASDDDLTEALRAAQALDIIEGKEGGLSAKLEENGRNLSGGQRQRLTIARALVKKPEILILDDSFSALDAITESRLRDAVTRLSYRPTVFFVSQRASAVLRADKILVLEDGVLQAQGTHEQLLRNCAVYREIYGAARQNGKEDENENVCASPAGA